MDQNKYLREKMVELRTIQITDIEDELWKLEAVKNFLKENKGTDYEVDAVFHTGDWIYGHIGMQKMSDGQVQVTHDGEHKTSTKVFMAIQESERSANPQKVIAKMKKFSQQHGGEEFNPDNLEGDDKDEFEGILAEFKELKEKLGESQKEAALAAVESSYQEQAAICGEISRIAPIYGTMGNHDLTVGYDVLSDHVTFLDREDKATKLNGRTGTEFIIRGDLNTFEVPVGWGNFAPLLREYFVDYISGESLNHLSKQERELPGKIDEAQGKRKDASGEDLTELVESIRAMEAKLSIIPEERGAVIDYNQAERKRLGNKPQENDIYLTHKLPSCDEAREIVGPAGSDITAEYSEYASAVYGGHFHDGQLGHQSLAKVIKALKGEEVEGISDKVETADDGTAIYYLDDAEPWHMNAGPDHMFVTEYDADKNITTVDIYEYVME